MNQIGYSKNIEHVSNTPAVGPFAAPELGTDIAFQGDQAYVGNYNGFAIYDISDPTAPKTLSQVCAPARRTTSPSHGDLLLPVH